MLETEATKWLTHFNSLVKLDSTNWQLYKKQVFTILLHVQFHDQINTISYVQNMQNGFYVNFRRSTCIYKKDLK